MTILAIILTAALALTLRATFRLIAQRDAERRRGDLALSELDAQIEDTARERERRGWEQRNNIDLAARIEQLEAEALPVLQPWSGPPSLRVVADVESLIFRSLDGSAS